MVTVAIQFMTRALEALLYRSRIVNRIGPLHMFLLVERARQANRASGVTGQLIYTDHSFVQYLEGAPAALDMIWRNLRRDPRHYDIELIARFPLERRRCPDSPLAFSSNAYFRQYQMGGFTTAGEGDAEALIDCCLALQQAAARSIVAPG